MWRSIVVELKLSLFILNIFISNYLLLLALAAAAARCWPMLFNRWRRNEKCAFQISIACFESVHAFTGTRKKISSMCPQYVCVYRTIFINHCIGMHFLSAMCVFCENTLEIEICLEISFRFGVVASAPPTRARELCPWQPDEWLSVWSPQIKYKIDQMSKCIFVIFLVVSAIDLRVQVHVTCVRDSLLLLQITHTNTRQQRREKENKFRCNPVQNKFTFVEMRDATRKWQYQPETERKREKEKKMSIEYLKMFNFFSLTFVGVFAIRYCSTNFTLTRRLRLGVVSIFIINLPAFQSKYLDWFEYYVHNCTCSNADIVSR